MNSAKVEETVRQAFSDYLKENKLRRTPERYAILEAIYSIEDSFSIEDLLMQMEQGKKFRVSRATVYNTLTLLTNANLVIHHQFGAISKYEKCFKKEIGYTVCTQCGRVTAMNNVLIEENIKANIKKFHLTHYSLYVYGLCSKCHRTVKRRRQKAR
ncbi:MAG: transcriptional repressor [Bacteroidaceae bacterium]|nr:transcriptional repressor [Bacteroidaceae bacterium]